VRFASREWFAALVAQLNSHPDLPAALSGLARDGALVVQADRGWATTTAVWGTHDGVRIERWRILADEDDLLELEPAYVLRARYGVWRDLLRGGDPVRAALSGQVAVEGDLEPLLRRTGYRHVVDAALAAIATEFPDS
jgi:hypothetical protein